MLVLHCIAAAAADIVAAGIVAAGIVAAGVAVAGVTAGAGKAGLLSSKPPAALSASRTLSEHCAVHACTGTQSSR